VIVSFDPAGLRPEFPRDETAPDDRVLAGQYELRQASVVLDGTTSVLDHVDLAIPPHEHVAVVGTAGSGKSTLALVLARLYGYRGTVLLDGIELSQVATGVAGRQIAYVGSEPRLFTGTLFDNVIYGLRHQSSAPGTSPAATGEWLDLAPLGVTDRAGLVAAVLDAMRLVEFDRDLFLLGLRSKIDPAKHPELAERLLVARRLVTERFAQESRETAVEFFDPDRFSAYASVGENILFGQSPARELALDELASHPHFRAVIAEVELEEPLIALGAEVAREMVEIFKDISADNELFANFSLIAAAELPEYAQLVSRLERMPAAATAAEHPPSTGGGGFLRSRALRRRLARLVAWFNRTQPGVLAAADEDRLIRLALRLIPARHRLGQIDDGFRAKVVSARRRFAETLPPELAASFVPYHRDRYLAEGTLLENVLFGKVKASSSVAARQVNAIVEEVLVRHDLREVVMEVGLGYHVGLFGARLAPPQRQRVALARALLKRPQILVLDGALGGLEATERVELHQRIREAMKGRTVIAVVERLDLARCYDRVVVLDSGRVVETGRYQDLAREDGLFRRLATQAGIMVGEGA
jgi:ABC-type branched-subunit amino acid transport system ATPase component